MQFAAEEVIPVTLIPGDGIGPEIVEATVMGARPFACPVCMGRGAGPRRTLRKHRRGTGAREHRGFLRWLEHYVPHWQRPSRGRDRLRGQFRAGCCRIAEFAFEYAARNGRKKVTHCGSIHCLVFS
jgi:hypothetical protein